MKKQKKCFTICLKTGLSLLVCFILNLGYAPAQIFDAVNSDEFTNITSAGCIVFGNAGNDVIRGGSGINFLNGNAGDDDLYGDSNQDFLSGGIGNDYLIGMDLRDQLVGGSGDDVLKGGNGNDVLYGDHGDYLYFDDPVTPGWTYSLIEDASDPNCGNVQIEKAGKVYGPEDMLFTYWDATYTVIHGTSLQAGNDMLYGGPGNDQLIGGDGDDTANYTGTEEGITVSLADGQAVNDGDEGTDSLKEIENIIGSAHADNITGDDNANTLQGQDGDDTIASGKGDDTLTGGTGTDLFIFAPGDGNNTITDYTAGETINLIAFGWDFEVQTSEAIENGSKTITINDDVVVTLSNYTGAVTYKKKASSAEVQE